MAVTEEERRIAKLYSLGYTLSAYAPRIMESIIKHNPKNEYAKIMQIGRDHYQFNANIPRKDYSREFKNGFHNGRSVVEHSPGLFDNLMRSKSLSKDYKKGLEAAKTEWEVANIQQRIKQEPKAPEKDLRTDETFLKGFNVGYRLAEGYNASLNHASRMNDKYAKFTEGIKAGQKQYEFDLVQLKEKNPNARLFPDDPHTSHYVDALKSHKVRELNDISESQLRAIDQSDSFKDVGDPPWLQKKGQDKANQQPAKTKSKDIDRD